MEAVTQWFSGTPPKVGVWEVRLLDAPDPLTRARFFANWDGERFGFICLNTVAAEVNSGGNMATIIPITGWRGLANDPLLRTDWSAS